MIGGSSSRPQSFQIELIGPLIFLVEHDLLGKPASTFPDHALGTASIASAMPWPPPMHSVTMPRLSPSRRME